MPATPTGTKPQRSAAETRLIMIRIVLLSFILFFNSISTCYLYSFLPTMMVNFGLVETVSKSGAYAAYMASGFFFGRFISASLWGIFIDKYGRKTGLLIVLSGVSGLTFMFGFAPNFPYALTLRTVTGFVNGLSIIGKTLSTEICPDDLKPWSISVTNTIWALGMTIGPFLGSVCFNKIEGYPYLLPSIAVTCVGILLLVLSWYYFDETLQTAQKLTLPAPTGPRDMNRLDESQENPEDLSVVQVKKPFSEMSKYEQFLYMFGVPNISKLVFIFGVNTFYAAVIGELIPFWVAAKYNDGGLSFQHNDISSLFLYLTAPQLILQIFLYPFIQKSKGDFWLLSVGHIIHIPVFFFLPYCHLFGDGNFFPQKFWIISWLFVRNMASFMNFSSLQRFTNDAIGGDKRGKLNGFQVTFSSCLQISGPFLGAWVLAWSLNENSIYPFNYHFVFLLMTAICAAIVVAVYRLDFIDEKKTKLKGENTMGL